ncbi:CAZyme family AA3 [Penicillium chermesinum]|uniref:CAZyme family AA3 n=1 Tax=Penicillium chermesinum TaxID=63820 RepID=A0A9W9TIG3_9EURO|nr:CAZyme family AA3 [Penicillium chermesinum]KAJ5224042.1 CAZyme family AA3 [Penicillium chermesinum]
MTVVQDNARFDFIVVGGGTAGNVVAGRLAENPNARILVVEAGVGNAKDLEEIRVPSNAMELRDTEYDWAFKSTMVKRDDYERIEKPNTRGKVLGGSSSLNYFTWAPGSKGTYDMWGKWTWEPLVHYLRKSATYHDDAQAYSPELQKIGKGGPIDISHAELIPEMQSFRELLTKAWTSTGHTLTENIFDGKMSGLVHSVNTIYKGRRSGSFLCVADKPNAHAKNLIIDAADKTCKGVTVILPSNSGQELNLFAEREVIVSEGVFETPKLLMLSGIGPAAELKKHGIPVIVDSPHVGQHLLDHPGVPFVLKVKDGFGMDDYVLREGTPHNKQAIEAYQKTRHGPLGSGFLELDPLYRQAKAANNNKDPFCPDDQPHFELDFICLFGSAFQWHYPTPKKGNYVTVMVDLVRPVSEGGTVTLNSADPLQQANINLNYFNNELDIIAIREGIRYAYDVLVNGEGFKDIVEDEYPFPMPLDDDKLMRRTVLDRSQTSYHPCGTARLSKNIQQGWWILASKSTASRIFE